LNFFDDEIFSESFKSLSKSITVTKEKQGRDKIGIALECGGDHKPGERVIEIHIDSRVCEVA
jgi:hypothetical protein